MGQSQPGSSIILRSNTSLFLTQEDYHSILEVCVPSEEVREQLSQPIVGKYALSQIIRNAPISLYEKASLMESLIPKENILYDLLRNIERWRSTRTGEYFHLAKWAIADSFFFQYKMMREAIGAFEESHDAVFNLVEKWYDDELLDEKSSSGAPFLSTQKAIDYIKSDMEECGFDDSTTAWYEIEKWVPDCDGNLELRYTYTVIGDTPVFCYEHRPCGAKRSFVSLVLDFPTGLLDIPLPCDVGEIVAIDCLPFAPPKPALIVVDSKSDSRYPQMLSRNQRGKWGIDSLKQGYFSNGAAGTFLALSPCYRLRIYDEPLTADEHIMLDVQEWLQSDSDRGHALQEAQDATGLYEMTSDDIRWLMKQVEDNLS